MKNFILSECDVLKVLKDRYKITPVRMEPYFNSVQISINQAVNLNIINDWFFDEVYFKTTVGPGTDLAKPFFVGHARAFIYRIGISTDTSGFWVQLYMQEIESISSIYNLDQRTWISYADGVTFLGPQLPGDRANESMDRLNNPHPVIGPYVRLVTFTDATGTMRFDCTIMFSGYRVYMS